MTFADRVQRVSRFGFTERQATFLVTVMLHAGVCVERQYCASAELVHGQKTRDFFHGLIANRHATAYPCARRGARVYHVHAKRLYDAIDEPNNRHRRPMALSRAIERLMVLDTVLGEPQVTWLATEDDKLAHFTLRTQLPREQLPRLVFRSQTSETIRYFPDKLPIGLQPDGRTHVFVYAVHRPAPGDFRVFLYRHAPLFRTLPRWTVRLVIPPHLQEGAAAYQRACEDELGVRLAPATVEELRWYFHQRREATANAGTVTDEPRYRRARRVFGAPRFRVLYRHWLAAGEPVIDALLSPVLSDAVTRGTGRIEAHVLTRRYHHLAPLVGTA
jgi:hypothetical protein